MPRKLRNVGILLTGTAVVLVGKHIICSMFETLQKSGHMKIVVNELDGNIMSDRCKTKVYRYDGNQFVRLHEFCTWTVAFNSVMLKTPSGKTPIHIHDPKVDKWVSGNVKKYGYWEYRNVRLIIDELKKDPGLGFMDLGSHVGVFSLSVAKYGRKVVSVDPLIENVQRLCKSVQNGGFTELMTIIFNPLSDEHTMVNFKRIADNVGGTSVIKATKGNSTKAPCEESDDSPTVMLDDLIPLVPFRKAVIKMDVQGYEYHVLKGASDFFQQIHVTAILMEWDMMKGNEEGRQFVDLLLGYRFKAYEPGRHGKELDPKKYGKWPIDVLWRR